MCDACWRDQGSPTEMPVNADAILTKITEFLALKGCSLGGPLHAQIEDMNADMDWRPWKGSEVHYSRKAMRTAREISDLMNPLPVPQRYALLAKFYGLF
jgi:hypothetical protein